MAGKFVRLSKSGRVSEIVSIDEPTKKKCVDLFKTMYHTDLVKDFKYYDDSESVAVGQVRQDDGFIDYVALPLSAEEQSKKDKRAAGIKADQLERKTIWLMLKYITSLDDCPQELKDMKVAIKAERDKL